MILLFSFLTFSFSVDIFAQITAIPLELNTPIESEIVEGKISQFSINLSANQTAVVEVEQKGVEISLAAIDPAGNIYLSSETPTGDFGTDSILVTAKEAGEYRVEVRINSTTKKSGEFSIELTEIRETVSEDIAENRTIEEIIGLAELIHKADKTGASADRREGIKAGLEIIRLSKTRKDIFWEAHAWQRIARFYLASGDVQKAHEAYSNTLEIARKNNLRNYENIALTGIGAVWLTGGDYEKAVSYSTEALQVSLAEKDVASQIINLSNLAFSYLLLKQPEKTIVLIEKAILPVAVLVKSLQLESTLLVVLGTAYIDAGNYEKGIESMQKGVEIGKNLDSPTELATLELALGKALLENGKDEESYESLAIASKLSEKTGNRLQFVEISYHLARIERERGNLSKAFERIEKALEIAENLRTNINNKDLRTSYFSTVQSSYELYIDMLVERGEKTDNVADIARAFEMSERSRSRNLVDLLKEARVDFKQGVNQELLLQQKDLLDALDKKYQQRQELFKGKPAQKEVDAVAAEINKLEIEIEKLDVRIRKENPRYDDLTKGKTLSAKEIQNLLDDETVLLEYKLGEKHSFVWLVTKNSIEVFKLPAREEIETKAKSFYDSIIANKKTEEANIEKYSKELSEILLAPVSEKISGKRLAIVAEGVLQYAPFSAIKSPESKVQSPKSDERLLVETNEIVILPSASALAQIRQNSDKSKNRNKTLAIFADPVFDSGDTRISKNPASESANENFALTRNLRDFQFDKNLPRLLASREEAKNISGFVGKDKVELKTGFEANLEAVENSNLADYRIIHFATHGLLNTSQPEVSGLVFSLYQKNGQKLNGFLTLNAIYNLNLSSDMVVLSACQTALGKDVRGEGLIGISRGFLYAGSNRIVASLWKVDDSATAEFMKIFYRNHLQNKMSATAALRQAKIEMKKIPRYNSPYYWSAFALLGDWQ